MGDCRPKRRQPQALSTWAAESQGLTDFNQQVANARGRSEMRKRRPILLLLVGISLVAGVFRKLYVYKSWSKFIRSLNSKKVREEKGNCAGTLKKNTLGVIRWKAGQCWTIASKVSLKVLSHPDHCSLWVLGQTRLDFQLCYLGTFTFSFIWPAQISTEPLRHWRSHKVQSPATLHLNLLNLNHQHHIFLSSRLEIKTFLKPRFLIGDGPIIVYCLV